MLQHNKVSIRFWDILGQNLVYKPIPTFTLSGVGGPNVEVKSIPGHNIRDRDKVANE